MSEKMKIISAFLWGSLSVLVIESYVVNRQNEVIRKLFEIAKDNHTMALALAQHVNNDVLEKILEDAEFARIARRFGE